jgi:hypothetical protein
MNLSHPDARHVQLADEYEAEWSTARVEASTSSTLLLRVADHSVCYGISVESTPFKIDTELELCPDWSLVRQHEIYLVIFGESAWVYPNGLSLSLPPEARQWSRAARAGWLFGYQQWLRSEDWIDVSFAGLDRGDEFEEWAYHAYIQLSEQEDEEQDADER